MSAESSRVVTKAPARCTHCKEWIPSGTDVFQITTKSQDAENVNFYKRSKYCLGCEKIGHKKLKELTTN